MEINLHVKKLKQLKGENYGEVARCIIFHEHVLKLVKIIRKSSQNILNHGFLGLLKKLKIFSADPYLPNSWLLASLFA